MWKAQSLIKDEEERGTSGRGKNEKEEMKKTTKTKQGQNERQESTVAARTMAANYSGQSVAERAARLEKSTVFG